RCVAECAARNQYWLVPNMHFCTATGAAEGIAQGYTIRVALVSWRHWSSVIGRPVRAGNRHAIGLPLYAVGRRAVGADGELGRLPNKDRLVAGSRIAEHIAQLGEDGAVRAEATGRELVAIDGQNAVGRRDGGISRIDRHGHRRIVPATAFGMKGFQIDDLARG